MTADQEVLYIVKANNTQAIDAFNKLAKAQEGVIQRTQKLANTTQNSNMLLMSTGRIVQDMPYGFMAVGNNITFMAEQMGYMRSQGMSTKDMLLGMVTALKGPMGFIFAISTATSLLTVFGKELFGTKDATEEAAKNVRTLRDEFESLKKSINDVNTALDFSNIEQMGRRKLGLKGLITATEQKLNIGGLGTEEKFALQMQLGDYKRELQSINSEQEYQLFVFEKWLKMQEEAKKNIEKIKEDMGEAYDLIEKATIDDDIPMFRDMRFGKSAERGGPAGKGSAMGAFSVQYAKNLALVTQLTMSSADVLRGEFMSAWEDIFGEANSLFEKFMANIVNQLTNLAITSLATSFVDPITGFLGGVLGLGKSSNGSTDVNLVLDNQTIAKVHVEGKRQATRLRMD